MKKIQNLWSKFFPNNVPIAHKVIDDNLLGEIGRWQKDKGDLTHRLNYSLNENSVVFDLGGYEGWFAARIFCKYLSKVYVFEPVVEYADFIRMRFEHAQQVLVFPFGLSNKTSIAEISILEHSSSIFKQGGTKLEIKLINFLEFAVANSIETIDLMKINIEGGEYDLLDFLIEQGIVSKIKNLQIQFHDFVPNALSRMESIQQRLSATHIITYQYHFIWENWKLKP